MANLVQLRHTYLRVLYPLLTYSQLRHPPYYKCSQLQDLFRCLSTTQDSHFNPIDETTLRLVKRCASVPWLVVPAPPSEPEIQDDRSETPSPVDSTASTSISSPPSKPSSPKKSRLLGISLQEHSESSVSVAEVARLTEKPGVETPSRSGRGRGRMRPPPPPPRKKKPKAPEKPKAIPPAVPAPRGTPRNETIASRC